MRSSLIEIGIQFESRLMKRKKYCEKGFENEINSLIFVESQFDPIGKSIRSPCRPTKAKCSLGRRFVEMFLPFTSPQTVLTSVGLDRG